MISINPSTLIFQIINFFVMVFILTRFFFRPVIRTLDERSRKVTSALSEAEQREREAKEIQAQYEQRLADAEEQVATMHRRAQDELEETRRRVLEETRTEIRELRERAGQEMEEARQEAIAQHRRTIGTLATTLSERLISEAGGESFQRASIEKFLEQLSALPPEKYRHVVDDHEAEVIRVQVTSACELDPDCVSRIERQVQQMMAKPADIRYRLDPRLIAGVSMRFGDVVIDGSVAGQLQDLNERYVAELEQSKV